jgi:hypothetical protein
MSRWLVIAVLALNAGCTTQRYLVLPTDTVVSPVLPESLAGQTWKLGDLSTRVEVSQVNQWGTTGSVASPNVDVDQLKEQLTARVRSTLMSQKGLGAVESPGVYSLEVELVMREAYGFGKGFWLGLGLEVGVLLAGAAAGLGVGTAINSGGREPLAPALGPSIGVLIATPLAIVAALLSDLGGVRGEYAATLTLRRRADRVPVATRHLTSGWKADYNGFGVPEKVAKFSGDAVPEFERVLVEGVKSMLLEVNEPLAIAR